MAGYLANRNRAVDCCIMWHWHYFDKMYVSMNIVCVIRNYRDKKSRAELDLDGMSTQQYDETTLLNGERGKRSSWSANDTDDSTLTTSGRRRPSLFRCLARVFGPALLKSHLCKLICDVLLFVGPMLQKWVDANFPSLIITARRAYVYSAHCTMLKCLFIHLLVNRWYYIETANILSKFFTT